MFSVLIMIEFSHKPFNLDLWLQFKIGDVVKLKSPVDSRVVALATVRGVWGQGFYNGSEIPPGQLIVTADEVFEQETPLLEKQHPNSHCKLLKDVGDKHFLWYQKLMRK